MTDKQIADRKKKFIDDFNELYKGKYEYVSGYYHSDKPFKMKCCVCGNTQERSAQAVRRKKEIKCNGCANIKREADKSIRHMSALNRMEKKKEETIERNRLFKQNITTYDHVCEECGTKFTSKRKVHLYCSHECMVRYNNSTKKHRKRIRVVTNGRYERIPLTKLINRDGNICHICNEECNKNDYSYKDNGRKVFGKLYPTVDHIIPICKGGTNTWDNVKLAHMKCNITKSGVSDIKMNKDVLQFDI